jgi:hypothetical protein
VTAAQNIRLVTGPDDPAVPADMHNWIIQRFVHKPYIFSGAPWPTDARARSWGASRCGSRQGTSLCCACSRWSPPFHRCAFISTRTATCSTRTLTTGASSRPPRSTRLRGRAEVLRRRACSVDPQKAARSRGYYITDYFFTHKQRDMFTTSNHLFSELHARGVDTDKVWRDLAVSGHRSHRAAHTYGHVALFAHASLCASAGWASAAGGPLTRARRRTRL